MGHYLANFVVYTMAMTGLICFAVFVYKKLCTGELYSKNSHTLNIEETLSINPRKSFMIVKAGNERFLVASDVDKTSLISKLENNETIKTSKIAARKLPQEIIEDEIPIREEQINKPVSKPVVAQTSLTSYEEQQLQLDEIYPNTAGKRRRNVHRQHSQVNNSENTVVLDFNKPKSHGLSSIKEMAKKINEL